MLAEVCHLGCSLWDRMTITKTIMRSLIRVSVLCLGELLSHERLCRPTRVDARHRRESAGHRDSVLAEVQVGLNDSGSPSWRLYRKAQD